MRRGEDVVKIQAQEEEFTRRGGDVDNIKTQEEEIVRLKKQRCRLSIWLVILLLGLVVALSFIFKQRVSRTVCVKDKVQQKISGDLSKHGNGIVISGDLSEDGNEMVYPGGLPGNEMVYPGGLPGNGMVIPGDLSGNGIEGPVAVDSNSDFMNPVFQVLSHTPNLIGMFLTNIVQFLEESKDQKHVIVEFLIFLQSVLGIERKDLTPVVLFNNLGKFFERAADVEKEIYEQDAFDFMYGLVKLTVKAIPKSMFMFTYRIERQYKKKNEQEFEVYPYDGGETHPEFCIEVQFETKRGVAALETHIETYFQWVETEIPCLNDGTYDARMQKKDITAPEIFIIVVRREEEYLMETFTFPDILDIFNISQRQTEHKNWIYKLFAVILRSGGGGHYRPLVKADDGWFLMDGDKISEKTEQFVHSVEAEQEVHCLVYERSPRELNEQNCYGNME